MSNSSRIKVAGYAQKTIYNNQIEYKNFSPDLVGVQLASNGGTPLFTMGNFAVTTNFDTKINKKFATNKFSNFITLTDLDVTFQSALNLLKNNDGVFLNLDKSNLINYSLFGSLKEFTRVTLENIITNWPAALYINPIYALKPLYETKSGYTFENYSYNTLTDEATFKVNTNVVTNNFDINFIDISINAQENTPKNLNINYQSYVIFVNNVEYSILEFTGSTSTVDDYMYFKIKGDAFSGISNNNTTYYIKPNYIKENLFYNSLSDFELYLLNRFSSPKFTSTFSFTEKADAGNILYIKETLTWPVSDGYNIDFNTEEYDNFASKLLEITTNYDLSTSNLMVRFLVTESITDFDTAAIRLSSQDQDDSNQKMNKTLMIYGAEYDEINRYITGIQYANVVTYNKVNNTPDIYLKNLARVFGWDLISTILENNLLKNYTQPSNSTYDGHSVGLTPVEADIELWRRIILNSPWLWKSKGTRKSIEFLFKFIGTPLGLIKFNEYIYLAENKIDTDILQSALALNNLPTNISEYPIGDDGYPLPKLDTPTMYFQSKGLWYRQTGGEESTIDITTGNNPHVGPYDGGYQYINQFRELIPNFSAVTVTSSTSTIVTTNLFTNYNFGSFTQYTGDTYVDITTDDGMDFSNCFVVSATTIEDPKKRQDQTDCGCDIPENLKSLSICLEKKDPPPYECGQYDDKQGNTTYGYNTYLYSQYDIDGVFTTIFYHPDCCKKENNLSYYYDEFFPNFNNNGLSISSFTYSNSGYICCDSNNKCGCYVTCKWVLSKRMYKTFNSEKYLEFETENGTERMTSQDGCNCVQKYTIPVFISASTSDVGYACKLTNDGIDDIEKSNSILYKTYENRRLGKIGCAETYIEPKKTIVYGIVFNQSDTINGNLNNFNFVDLNQSNIFDYYENVTLTAQTQPSTYNVGYFNRIELTSQPTNNDTIRIAIAKNPQPPPGFINVNFDISIGDGMYYLISDTDYNNNTINFTDLTQLSTQSTKINGEDFYASEFTYDSNFNTTYVYIGLNLVTRPTTPTGKFIIDNQSKSSVNIISVNPPNFYTLTMASPFPVLQNETRNGGHDGFSGQISVEVGAGKGKLLLSKNGNLLETIIIQNSSNNTHTFKTYVFSSSDEIKITLVPFSFRFGGNPIPYTTSDEACTKRSTSDNFYTEAPTLNNIKVYGDDGLTQPIIGNGKWYAVFYNQWYAIQIDNDGYILTQITC